MHYFRACSVVELAFGIMKICWQATLSKALEVHPNLAQDIIACCALLHNLCLKMNNVLEETEDLLPDKDLSECPLIGAGGQ